MPRIISLFSVFLLLASLVSLADDKPILPLISPVPGGITLVKTVSVESPRPEAYFSGNRVAIVNVNNSWTAVIGLNLDTSPGPHVLYTVTGNGDQKSYSFNVRKHSYPKQNLSISNRRQVEPTERDLERIMKESEIIHSAFELWTEKDADNFIFSLPVKGRLSSKFGLRRFFNNKPRKPHSGIDIAAPLGTRIISPADGNIIVTGNYFFNGNTVFINHGHGLVTMYNHLNAVYVRQGQNVKRGKVIGTIGKTGRVTGPHLHWSVSLNNARINPLLLLNKRARKYLGIKRE